MAGTFSAGRRWGRGIGVAVLCTVVGTAAAVWIVRDATPATAATFTVTTTADTDDGTCSVSDCSLREAVNAANASGGADDITLPSGTYTLNSGLTHPNAGALTIAGVGATPPAIDGLSNSVAIALSTGGPLTLSNVRLNATSDTTDVVAIRVGGLVDLTDAVVEASATGGGNATGVEAGDAVLARAGVLATATLPAASGPGAETVAVGCECDDVTMTESGFSVLAQTISEEGGTTAYGCRCDDVTITRGNLTGWAIATGGFADGTGCLCDTLDVTTANVLGISNGGVEGTAFGCSCGDATVTDSRLSATAVSGRADAEGRAVGCRCDGTVTLTRTTVLAGAGIDTSSVGDARAVSGGSGTATDTTLLAFTEAQNGSTRAWESEGDVDFVHVTAIANGGDATAFSAGAGSAVANSILGGSCTELTSLGGNISVLGLGCSADLIASHDKVVADLGLQPVNFSGVPGPFAVPTTASPAFDNALAAHCTPTDERGVPRPQYAACDSGAVELAATPVSPPDPSPPPTAPTPPAVPPPFTG